MRKEANLWALITMALGFVAIAAYCVQFYGFTVVGERLLLRLRLGMLKGTRETEGVEL